MLHRPLTYDADMPYLLNHPGDLAPRIAGLKQSMQRIKKADKDCWISAIECYASQLDSVYGNHAAMLQSMQAHWLEHHGVRFWTVPRHR